MLQRTRSSLAALCLGGALVAGCGQKGPLTLPASASTPAGSASAAAPR